MEIEISLQNFILSGVLLQSLRLWLIIVVGLVPLSLLVSEAYNRIRIKKIKLVIDLLAIASRTTPLLFQFYFFYFGLITIQKTKLDPGMSGSLSFMVAFGLFLIELLNEEIKSLKKMEDSSLIKIIPSISDQLSVLIYGTALISIAESSKSLKNTNVCVFEGANANGFVIIGCLYLVLAIIFVTLNILAKKLMTRRLK